MITAVLFDFDGTLSNSLGTYIKVYRQTLSAFGFNLSDEEIVKRCFAKKEEEICDFLGISEKTDEFRKLYFESKHELLQENLLFPDALDLLKDLRRTDIKMGIVTFTRRWYIDKMVDQLDIRRFFDSILSFDDVINAKPDPEMVIKSCENLYISPLNTIVVGDSKGDIMMGRAAGVKTALYFPKENQKFYNLDSLKETKPDFIVSSLSELKSIITPTQ